jgi:hypothetical protein
MDNSLRRKIPGILLLLVLVVWAEVSIPWENSMSNKKKYIFFMAQVLRDFLSNKEGIS